jgi:hypothetical protein
VPCAPAAAIYPATQLLDLEFEVTDQGLGRLCVSSLRLGARRGRFRFKARGAVREDHRMRGGKIGGERFRCGHDGDGIFCHHEMPEGVPPRRRSDDE